MGAGASALGADDPGRNATNPTGNLNLTRLRKSLLIRAYNVRNQGIDSCFVHSKYLVYGIAITIG
jgi:hypothetical protein